VPSLGSTAKTEASSRYEIVGQLGEGGMAKVYVAVSRGAEGFSRSFVIKRLRPELAGNTEAVNQFIDEGRLGASLVHSNIVPVLDFGRDADGYFLAQEYILGRSIGALVEASVSTLGQPLTPRVVLYLAQEALKALSYAHGLTDDRGAPMRLVHRDVSPSNLMVSARGEVKLLDFGIVKSESRLTKTQAGMVKGNLFFMSPEQAKGLEVDARSDVFSLGMVLLNASLGTTLYSGNTSYELLNRAGAGLTDEDLGRLRSMPLGGLLEKALKRDPGERYASADEFAKAVAAVGTPATAAEVGSLVEQLFGAALALETSQLRAARGHS
jgi:serine/threonine-protein kinase